MSPTKVAFLLNRYLPFSSAILGLYGMSPDQPKAFHHHLLTSPLLALLLNGDADVSNILLRLLYVMSLTSIHFVEVQRFTVWCH